MQLLIVVEQQAYREAIAAIGKQCGFADEDIVAFSSEKAALGANVYPFSLGVAVVECRPDGTRGALGTPLLEYLQMHSCCDAIAFVTAGEQFAPYPVATYLAEDCVLKNDLVHDWQETLRAHIGMWRGIRGKVSA